MLGKSVENFLQMMAAEKGSSVNTCDAYRRDLAQFFEIGSIHNYTDISKSRIESFIQFSTKIVGRKRVL